MNTQIQKSIRFPAKVEEVQDKKEPAQKLMFEIEKAKRDVKQGRRPILKTSKDIDLYLCQGVEILDK